MENMVTDGVSARMIMAGMSGESCMEGTVVVAAADMVGKAARSRWGWSWSWSWNWEDRLFFSVYAQWSNKDSCDVSSRESNSLIDDRMEIGRKRANGNE